MIQAISFPAAGGRPMRAWLAAPTPGPRPAPAVLVIHEILGLIDNQRAILERFAREGYVALAPDMFDRPGATKAFCVARTVSALRSGEGEAVEDLRAAMRFLAGRDDVDGRRLGVAGFCMGGGFALLMALEPDIRAAAPFYGTAAPWFDRVEESCPVVASFGAEDVVFRRQARRLERALAASKVPHDFRVYEGAGHSFMTADLPGLQGRLGAVGPFRARYVREAAEDAWSRMLAFFGHYVVSVPEEGEEA